jgi:hypothetical protein
VADQKQALNHGMFFIHLQNIAAGKERTRTFRNCPPKNCVQSMILQFTRKLLQARIKMQKILPDAIADKSTRTACTADIYTTGRQPFAV